MHAHGARALELGAGGNCEWLTREWRSKIPIGLASICCRFLREGIHGGTSANTPGANALCSRATPRHSNSAEGIDG